MAATNVVNVVVHLFVADSSLLDRCDLVVCFFHLMFAGRLPFAFLRWFQPFCLFHLVSAVACLTSATIFRLSSTFVVWSFFLCHRHLWSFLLLLLPFFFLHRHLFLSYMAISAVGIRARLTVFAFFLS